MAKKKERRVSFREKTVENIMTGIENSKQVPFQKSTLRSTESGMLAKR